MAAVVPFDTHSNLSEGERLGDQIAELNAYLTVTQAHFLDLLRQFSIKQAALQATVAMVEGELPLAVEVQPTLAAVLGTGMLGTWDGHLGLLGEVHDAAYPSGLYPVKP